MTTYKVSTIGFYPDFDLLFTQIFGGAQHCASKVMGNVAYYAFETVQTPADLGPMVKIEVVENQPTSFYV
jgi:hypothetical protein